MTAQLQLNSIDAVNLHGSLPMPNSAMMSGRILLGVRSMVVSIGSLLQQDQSDPLDSLEFGALDINLEDVDPVMPIILHERGKSMELLAVLHFVFIA